jgi:hypothetical protein
MPPGLTTKQNSTQSNATNVTPTAAKFAKKQKQKKQAWQSTPLPARPTQAHKLMMVINPP